jgi:hypothetical protein
LPVSNSKQKLSGEGVKREKRKRKGKEGAKKETDKGIRIEGALTR